MRRLLLILGLCASLFPGRALAEEQILYWLVDSGHTSVFPFNYAILYAQVGDAEKQAIGGATLAMSDSPIETDLLAALQTTDLAGYRFFIELINFEAGEMKGVAITQTSSYSDLSSNHHILGAAMTDVTNLVYWTPYFMIPEPTSGLLLLIGSALLALRRRRRA